MVLSSSFQGVFHRGGEHRPIRAKIIQCARANQRFQRSLVHPFWINATTKIEKIFKWAIGATGLNNHTNWAFTDTANGAQAINDAPFRINGELVATDINIRRCDGQLEVAALLN